MFGENAQGKTSLAEAIKFAFVGTAKGSKELINTESDRAEIELTLEANDTEVVIKKTIDQKEGLKSSYCVGGDWIKSPKQELLKQFCGYASFNPSDIIEPKQRNKVFSSLITDKFVMPKEIEQFPEEYRKSLSGDDKPIEKLNQIKESLFQYRLLLGREKKTAEAIYKEAQEELDERNKEIIQLGFDVGTLRETSEAKAEKLIFDKKKLEYEKEKQEKETLENEKQSIFSSIAELKAQLAKLEGKHEEISKLLTSKSSLVSSLESIPESLIQEIRACEVRDRIKHYEEKKTEKKAEFKKKEDDYYVINKFLREEFNKLYGAYIDPIKKVIPKLSFSDGEFLYENKKIDDLSKSESLRLSLDLINAQKTEHNVVVLDNSECFDETTASNLSTGKEGTTFFLMKVGSPFVGLEGKKIELKF